MDLMSMIHVLIVSFLFVIHSIIYFSYKNNFHLFMAVAWLSNLTYIFLEKNTGLLNSEITSDLMRLEINIILNFITSFFAALSFHHLKKESKLTVIVIGFSVFCFLIGIMLAFYLDTNYSDSTNIDVIAMIPTIASCFLAFIFICIYFSKLNGAECRFLISKEDSIDAVFKRLRTYSKTLDTDLGNRKPIFIEKARSSFMFIAAGFFLYSIVQWSYPAAMVYQKIVPLSFAASAIAKISIAIGFARLLLIEMKIRELQLEFGNNAMKLNTLTVAIEHDIKPCSGQVQPDIFKKEFS